MKNLFKGDPYKCITVEFGTGEVSVGTGFIDDPCVDIGVLTFRSQEPEEIGCETCHENPFKMPDPELQFVFTKEESIDVIINALNKIKEDVFKKGW